MSPTSRARRIAAIPCAALAWVAPSLAAPLAAPLGAQQVPPAVVVSGAGSSTYVLLSGLVGGVAGFRRLEERLVSAGHRVVRIDPYQLSIDSADVTFDALARRVDRVLAAQGVTSARVVGHAHGGGVALRLAASAPRRVEAVYLLDVGAQARNRGPVLGATMKLVPVITRIPGGRGFVRGRFVKELRGNGGRGEWLDEATQRAYTERVLDAIGRVIAMATRLAEAEEPEPVEVALGRVHVPVVALLGEIHAPAGPTEDELTALGALPTPASVERIAGVAHFPHEEDPDAVARVLLRAAPVVIAARAGGAR